MGHMKENKRVLSSPPVISVPWPSTARLSSRKINASCTLTMRTICAIHDTARSISFPLNEGSSGRMSRPRSGSSHAECPTGSWRSGAPLRPGCLPCSTPSALTSGEFSDFKELRWLNPSRCSSLWPNYGHSFSFLSAAEQISPYWQRQNRHSCSEKNTYLVMLTIEELFTSITDMLKFWLLERAQ